MRSAGAFATASVTLVAAIASRSARAPTTGPAAGRPITLRAVSLTIAYAWSGVRWPAVTSSDAVSRASLRPTGLNGSRTLSAPAATRTPASRSAWIAVRPRGVDTGCCQPCRYRFVIGRVMTPRSAATTSATTWVRRSVSIVPRRTQCPAEY